MSATLYLLRQTPDAISPSLFQVSDEDIDIVYVEQMYSVAPSSIKRGTDTDEEIVRGGSRQMLTYDDLVEKIFSSEHVIVL
ncbi:MAG: hypothetical protein ABI988_05200 [Nitrospirota bacterium]